MFDHLFRNFEVRDDPFSQGSNSLDVARRTAEHDLGFLANGENLPPPFMLHKSDNRRLVQDNASTLYINKSIGSPEINGQVGRKRSEDSRKHEKQLLPNADLPPPQSLPLDGRTHCVVEPNGSDLPKLNANRSYPKFRDS